MCTSWNEGNYARHALFTLDFFRRLIQFSLIGVFGTGLVAFSLFEGAHMYVEKVELAPEQDGETQRWEWDLEAERWTGGRDGGTDSGLGFKGRHAVRAAFMSLNWGVGSSKVVEKHGGSGTVNTIDAPLEYAQEYLNIAYNIAQSKEASGSRLRPETVAEILARRADAIERMGTPETLFEARAEYQHVWARLSANTPDAARIALKLGDLNNRLGNTQDALLWWSRSIHLIDGHSDNHPPVPVIPASPPASPYLQRTLASALVSLSAFYATSGQLHQAEIVQNSALGLLREAPVKPLSGGSAPERLHGLYLLHRSSLLSIHHAEVLYALRKPLDSSIGWLTKAAKSSEQVALALTGLPPTHPDAPQSKIPHPPASEAPLLTAYSKSQSMKKPARNLLRDARRSAAEAWNLVGILTEKKGDIGAINDALECYERALGWAGVAADKAGGIGRAGEGVLDAEWAALWGNYVRVKEAVHKPHKA
ncbi:hypothetical protein DENSPDRAFT_864997 [Dentipellis sp. KUC8613]|nr:hypothetical protein DENSPDRAFT_864997 [Dentipellis sp. KUC8613]